MEKSKKETKKLFIYPILLGIYPSLYLLAQNLAEIQVADAFRVLFFSILISTAFYLAVFLIIKNRHLSALLSSLVLLLFYSYGHLYFFFKENLIFGFDLSRIRYLIPLYLLLLVICVWLLVKFKDRLSTISNGISVFSVIVLAFPVFQIGGYFLKQDQYVDLIPEVMIQNNSSITYPDIYYIVLDGYSRTDVLMDQFGYDNSPFMQSLIDLDFYIAQCSQANYSWTLPSLASTLNMAYLDKGSGNTEVSYSDDEMYSLIDNNRVRETLEGLGYSIIAFENGFNWLHWYDADQYLSAVGDEEGFLRLGLGMNSFELLMLETTALRIVLDANLIKSGGFSADIVSNPREIQRQRIEYTLDTLAEIPNTIGDQKFVYAHIVSPHDPYIYNANGEFLPQDPEDVEQAYIDQLHYLNGHILEMISALKESSSGEAIIIIQADHGAPIGWDKSDETLKLGILNAYYLPDLSMSSTLYDSISPVNTFRTIFKHYFGADLEIRPDVSVFGGSSPAIELPCEAAAN